MSLLSSFARLSLRPSLSLSLPTLQHRNAGQLAPKRVKYRKKHKGRVPIPIGGSIKGTTLSFGDFGIRVKEQGMRISAKQLASADVSLKRKLKVVKDAKSWMRVFPDLPVCVKGNETRMGKGKGTFEFWAVRCPVGRVIFEVGGDIQEEIAREALRLAADKLPVKTEFITRATGPRLGNLQLPKEGKVPKPDVIGAIKKARKAVPALAAVPPPVPMTTAGELRT